MKISDARQLLQHCNSYEVLPALLRMCGDGHVGPKRWLRLIGEEWTRIDNFSQHLDQLWESPLGIALHRPEKYRHHLMDANEKAAFEQLPDEMTVYRGCYEHNIYGLSWSVDRNIAIKFPYLSRYRHDGQPMIVESKVHIRNVCGLKLDRGEQEIIAWLPNIVSKKPIKDLI